MLLHSFRLSYIIFIFITHRKRGEGLAKKTKKQKKKMPPLSAVDKLIYGMIFLLLCAVYFVLLFGPLQLRHKTAFADSAVVALDDVAGSAWLLIIPWLTFFLNELYPVAAGLSGAQTNLWQEEFSVRPAILAESLSAVYEK